MEVSNIHKLLSQLQNNLVTLPIKCNEFEETRCNSVYTNLNKNPGEGLDDMLQEVRSYRKNNNHRKVVYEVEKKIELPSNTNRCAPPNMRPFESMLLAVASITEPLLSLSKNESDMQKAIKNTSTILKDYLVKTQVKNLDIAKYKYTKKKLKEILETCIDAPFDIDNLKGLTVVASRCLNINFRILHGDVVEFECLTLKAPSTAIISHMNDDMFKLLDIVGQN
jgi:hypothetical protein